jgi:hypothetical protein
LIGLSGAFAIGWLWMMLSGFLIEHIFHVKPLEPQPAWVKWLEPFEPFIFWGLALSVGLSPSFWLYDKFLALWPTVELQTGKEYAQIAWRRKKYGAAFVLLVLPLLTNLIYDGIKALAK